ncbi:MAG: hypothetical protein IRZ16_04560 [Myxococcaceae bacterium]|nr:hypothetical protein [Myxococcaceae bacterium]
MDDQELENLLDELSEMASPDAPELAHIKDDTLRTLYGAVRWDPHAVLRAATALRKKSGKRKKVRDEEALLRLMMYAAELALEDFEEHPDHDEGGDAEKAQELRNEARAALDAIKKPTSDVFDRWYAAVKNKWSGGGDDEEEGDSDGEDGGEISSVDDAVEALGSTWRASALLFFARDPSATDEERAAALDVGRSLFAKIDELGSKLDDDERDDFEASIQFLNQLRDWAMDLEAKKIAPIDLSDYMADRFARNLFAQVGTTCNNLEEAMEEDADPTQRAEAIAEARAIRRAWEVIQLRADEQLRRMMDRDSRKMDRLVKLLESAR